MPSNFPPDIEQIWGEGRIDSFGNPVASLATFLIEKWGLNEFRLSAIHRAALAEHRIALRREENARSYLKRAAK